MNYYLKLKNNYKKNKILVNIYINNEITKK